jgi:ribosomal protein L21E
METGPTARPIALEVIRNGRSLCIAGMSGNPGVLTAILLWVNRGKRDKIDLTVSGHDQASSEDLTWANQALKMGDEVVIRVMESVKITQPKSRQKALTREFAEKQEKAYLRRTARKYGYKLVKS